MRFLPDLRVWCSPIPGPSLGKRPFRLATLLTLVGIPSGASAQRGDGKLGSYTVHSTPELRAEGTAQRDVRRVTGRRTPSGGVRIDGALSAARCTAQNGGPHVRILGSATPIRRGSLGLSRTVRLLSRGYSNNNPAPECQIVEPQELAGRIVYRDTWLLTRPWDTAPNDADALIIQPSRLRGIRLPLDVRANGAPVLQFNPHGLVDFLPASSANLTITATFEMQTAVPAPRGIRPPCRECGPYSRDSASVSIATLGDAMRLTNMPHAPGRPGWVEVRTVLSRSALRERLQEHFRNVVQGCPGAATLLNATMILCGTPIIEFVREGIAVTLDMRPAQWNGGDTIPTILRLLYPLRPLNGALVVRDPMRYVAEAPLQSAYTGAIDRWVVANPIEVFPLSEELTLTYARQFGNACLFPNFTLALPPTLSEEKNDALLLRIPAPVTVATMDACPGVTRSR